MTSSTSTLLVATAVAPFVVLETRRRYMCTDEDFILDCIGSGFPRPSTAFQVMDTWCLADDESDDVGSDGRLPTPPTSATTSGRDQSLSSSEVLPSLIRPSRVGIAYPGRALEFPDDKLSTSANEAISFDGENECDLTIESTAKQS